MNTTLLAIAYHAIAASPSPVTVSRRQFESDLRQVRDAGFEFVSLDDCAEWLSGNRVLPERAAVVTFDDGYASVVSDALPALHEMRVPAAVFVIAGRMGGDNQWPGQWRSIAPMRLADRSQLAELVSAGVAIGSHTTTHPDLTELAPSSLDAEVVESRDRLEQMFQVPVRHFAYPYGAHAARERDLVARHYATAVGTTPALVTQDQDRWNLCRAEPQDVRLALRLGLRDRVSLDGYLAVRAAVRRVRRRAERWLPSPALSGGAARPAR